MMLGTLVHLNASQLNDDFTSQEALKSLIAVMAFDIDMFHLGRMRRCFSRRKQCALYFPSAGGTAWQDGL